MLPKAIVPKHVPPASPPWHRKTGALEFLTITPRGESGATVYASFLGATVPSWQRRYTSARLALAGVK